MTPAGLPTNYGRGRGHGNFLSFSGRAWRGNLSDRISSPHETPYPTRGGRSGFFSFGRGGLSERIPSPHETPYATRGGRGGFSSFGRGGLSERVSHHQSEIETVDSQNSSTSCIGLTILVGLAVIASLAASFYLREYSNL